MKQTWWQCLFVECCYHLRQNPVLCDGVSRESLRLGTPKFHHVPTFSPSVLNTEQGLFYASQAFSHWAVLLAPCRDFSLLGFRDSRLKGPVPRKVSSFFHWVLQMRLELELDISAHLWVLSWGKTGEKGGPKLLPLRNSHLISGGKVKAVSAWPCQLKEPWTFGAANISPVAGEGRDLGIAWEWTFGGLKMTLKAFAVLRFMWSWVSTW